MEKPAYVRNQPRNPATVSLFSVAGGLFKACIIIATYKALAPNRWQNISCDDIDLLSGNYGRVCGCGVIGRGSRGGRGHSNCAISD